MKRSMSLVSRIGNALKALTNSEEAPTSSKPTPDSELTDHLQTLDPFRGDPNGRANAAEASITVMRCINFRINHVRNVEWYVRDMSSEGGDTIIESYDGKQREGMPTSFTNMIMWHRRQWKQNFFDRWLKMLLVHGNVYMEKLINEAGFPGGLRILNSLYITPEIDQNVLKYFTYDVEDFGHMSQIKIPPNELLWDILPSLHSDWRGKSPMDRALDAVNVDRYNVATLKSYLLNDNKPAAILTPHPNAPNYGEEEIERFLDAWTRQGKGAESGYRTRVLTAPFELSSFDTQRPNMEYSFEMAALICREFGVDPTLIGIMGDNDGSAFQKNSETRFINALTDAVKPDLHHLQDFINASIMPFLYPENPEYLFTWNFNNIDRMIKYSEKSVDQLRSDLLSGVITKNEYREARYYPKLDDAAGDVFIVPKGYIHVSREDMETLSIIRELDTKIVEELVEQTPEESAFQASGSPDFAQTMTGGDQRPMDNRDPREDVHE